MHPAAAAPAAEHAAGTPAEAVAPCGPGVSERDARRELHAPLQVRELHRGAPAPAQLRQALRKKLLQLRLQQRPALQRVCDPRRL
ncbi:hypothetical protein D3C73_1223810 [compost metagenome]